MWKLDNDDTQDCLNFLAQIDSDDYENSQQSTEIILMILARFFVDDETSELNSNQTYDYGSIDDDDATQQNFKQVCNYYFFFFVRLIIMIMITTPNRVAHYVQI